MLGWSRAAIAPTSRAKSSTDSSSATRSSDIILIATRRLRGGDCTASYTSPNAPEPIQRVTRQSPSSASCNKYLQKRHATCSSTATDTAFAPSSVAAEDEIPLFSCDFLGFKQCIITLQ